VETSKYNLVKTALDKTKKVSKFRSKGQGHWERKCKKSFFAHIFVKSGLILRQDKTKMTTTYIFYTYRRIHFTS